MQLGRYLTRRGPDSIARFPGIRELPIRTSGAKTAAAKPAKEAKPVEQPDAKVDP